MSHFDRLFAGMVIFVCVVAFIWVAVKFFLPVAAVMVFLGVSYCIGAAVTETWADYKRTHK